MAVGPGYRRRGVARALLHECERTAARWSFPEVDWLNEGIFGWLANLPAMSWSRPVGRRQGCGVRSIERKYTFGHSLVRHRWSVGRP
eukprot:1107569-Prorocentrum_minimum.AAC.1